MKRACGLQQHETTCHPAPHGRSEEGVFVLHEEVIQTVFLEGGGEELGLLGDQFLAGVEVPGDAGEVAPWGGAGGQVVGLDGELDVQDLGVGAQHVPGHVDFHKQQFVIYYLQRRVVLSTRNSKRNIQREQSSYRLCCLQLHSHLHQAGFKVLSPPLRRRTQKRVSMSF